MAGIPASQQHLVWQSDELADERSLQDCRVRSGDTLRLVLNMRGGPINTRRGLYVCNKLIAYSDLSKLFIVNFRKVIETVFYSVSVSISVQLKKLCCVVVVT